MALVRPGNGPRVYDLAAALQHVAPRIALLDLTADRVGEGLFRQLVADPVVRTPGPERTAETVHRRVDSDSPRQPAPRGFEGGAAGPPSLAPAGGAGASPRSTEGLLPSPTAIARRHPSHFRSRQLPPREALPDHRERREQLVG